MTHVYDIWQTCLAQLTYKPSFLCWVPGINGKNLAALWLANCNPKGMVN